MSPDIYKSHPPKMDLGPIKDVLGDAMPEITPTPLGRYRLVSALQNKFGSNYRNTPSALKALTHFDNEHKYFKALRQIAGGGNG